MKSTGMIIFLVLLIVAAICVGKPYLNKYMLGKDIEAAAIYGTKHSIIETENLLDSKMKKAGRDLSSEDFFIEKDRRNNVTISITYKDDISILGIVLKELELEISKTAHEVDALI